MKYRRQARRGGETGSFWLSFSDMMSVLVLIFIFVIFGMLYTLDETKTGLDQMRSEYAAAMADLDESKNAQQQLIILLSDRETELMSAQTELDSAKNELSTAKNELDAAKSELDAAQAQLVFAQSERDNAMAELSAIEDRLNSTTAIISSLTSENQSLRDSNAVLTSEMDALSQKYIVLAQDKSVLENSVSSLESQINSLKQEIARKQNEYDMLAASAEGSNALIASYQTELASYKKQLEETQSNLEQMLGVKTKLIERLSLELSRNNISVGVDAQTGAISLSGGALFDTGKTYLKDGGKTYLDSVLPVYFSVLMSNEFRPYIAEIVIEGHTDSTGTGDSYLNNLELSQQRAYAVADYVLSPNYMVSTLRLTVDDARDLRSLISASGRSYSALIYNPDGTENREASRRVEIKFRLKDDETIDATKLLLGLLG